MTDMSHVIIPKSDQINYDDFLSGPRTFRITGVRVKHGQEQPVEISLEGTDKFYRPCKSMSRCIVAAWGADSKIYVGRSLTLYGDPHVKWGGMEVGGIRISHMSDIETALTMALTMTKQSRKPFTVKPLARVTTTESAGTRQGTHVPVSDALSSEKSSSPADPDEPLIDDKQEGALLDLLLANGVEMRDLLTFGEWHTVRDMQVKYFTRACAWIRDDKSVRTKRTPA